MTYKLVLAAGFAALVAGCTGTSGVKQDTAGQDIPLPDIIAANDAFLAKIGGTNIENVPVAPNSVLPKTTATYSGAALVSQENTDGDDFVAMGAVKLSADFQNGTLTGSADNFYQLDQPVTSITDATGQRIDGTLSYDLTQSVIGENAFEGKVEGSLTKLSGEVLDIDLNAGGAVAGEAGGGFAMEAFNDGGSGIGSGVFALED